jgi:uncharacterized protein (DUF1778 family)
MAETKPTKPKRRRKRASERRENAIRVMATDAQKETLREAASREGLAVSSWLLMVGLREAQKAKG